LLLSKFFLYYAKLLNVTAAARSYLLSVAAAAASTFLHCTAKTKGTVEPRKENLLRDHNPPGLSLNFGVHGLKHLSILFYVGNFLEEFFE